MFLTASCGETRVETRLVVPHVPSDLRSPCIPPEREYETVADAALIFTDHVEALDCANGKIEATNTILTKAEKEAEQ